MSGTLHLSIVGVGALGCLFGSSVSRTAKADCQVTSAGSKVRVCLVGSWAAQIDTLQRQGLTVLHLDGRQTQERFAATSDLSEVPGADVVLVLVKSYQTQQAAYKAARIVRPEGVVISLQNGLGNLSVLAEAVGQQRVAAGVTSQGAYLLAPGILQHAGQGPTYLGSTPVLAQKLERVADLLSQSGLETTLVDNIDGLLWGKLVVNAAINPLTALLNIPNGQLLDTAARRQLVASAAHEVARVAAAQGIVLPFTDAAEQAFQVCRATAANHSSMLQDIQRGALTEIDAISGAVVRFGRQMGLPTPVNEMLFTLVKTKEQGQDVDLTQLPA